MHTDRPSKPDYYLEIARTVAKRSTCLRRAVGAVLVNKRGHILATGYNGVAAGMPHCNHVDQFDPQGYPYACKGAHAPSGTQLNACEAIHAEQNALLQCKDVWDIDVCYTTVSPCIHCIKLLMNTSCRLLVFDQIYPGSTEALALWTRHGGTYACHA